MQLYAATFVAISFKRDSYTPNLADGARRHKQGSLSSCGTVR